MVPFAQSFHCNSPFWVLCLDTERAQRITPINWKLRVQKKHDISSKNMYKLTWGTALPTFFILNCDDPVPNSTYVYGKGHQKAKQELDTAYFDDPLPLYSHIVLMYLMILTKQMLLLMPLSHGLTIVFLYYVYTSVVEWSSCFSWVWDHDRVLVWHLGPG